MLAWPHRHPAFKLAPCFSSSYFTISPADQLATITLQTLKPEYAAAATALKELHPGIIVAKLDGDAEPQLAERFGAEGFPTLIWVHKGKEEASYTGEPTK